MWTIGGLQKLVLLAAALCAAVFVPWGFVRKREITVPFYLALEAYSLPLILAGFLVAFVAPSRSRDGLILASLLVLVGAVLGLLTWIQLRFGRSMKTSGGPFLAFALTDALFLAIFTFLAWRLVHVLRSGTRG